MRIAFGESSCRWTETHRCSETSVRFLDGQQGLLAGEPGAVAYRTQDAGCTWRSGRAWGLVSAETTKPRLLFGTPHDRHVASAPWPAMADDHDVFAAFGERTLTLSSHSAEAKRINTNVGCLDVGMRGTRSMLDMPAGRRREPHGIHHLYQNWQGVEPAERRLAAAIRSLKPEVVIAERPILQEGYVSCVWIVRPCSWIETRSARTLGTMASLCYGPVWTHRPDQWLFATRTCVKSNGSFETPRACWRPVRSSTTGTPQSAATCS